MKKRGIEFRWRRGEGDEEGDDGGGGGGGGQGGQCAKAIRLSGQHE